MRWESRKGAALALGVGLLLRAPAQQLPRDQAVPHYRRALEFLHKGPLAEALTEARTAQDLDPENSAYRFRTGVALLYLGRYRDALDIFHRLDPVHSRIDPQLWYAYTAWAHLELHETTRASLLINDYLGANIVDPGGLMSSMQALLQARFHNDKQAAQAIAQALADRGTSGRFRHTAYNLACAYALLGNQAEAIHWLREASQAGLPCAELFRSDPNLRSLSKNPGFQKVLAEAAQIARG